MESRTLNLAIADAFLLAHALFVAFIVVGLLSIIVGRFFHWNWIRNPWFRLAHLVGIFIVVLQSWLGIICPLTTWEMAFRARAGDATYPGAFVSHWLSKLLYYQAPDWLFAVCYSVFGLLVFAAWYWVRPRSFHERRPNAPG